MNHPRSVRPGYYPAYPEGPVRPMAPNNNLDLSRRKQINTLMIFNERVSEIQPGVHYRVEFDKDEIQLALEILLPSEFPSRRPAITLRSSSNAKLSHSWIDQFGNITGAPGLLNFSVHSDLGRVVQAIKRELEKNLHITRLSAPTSTQSLSVSSPPTSAHQPSLPNGFQRSNNYRDDLSHPAFQLQHQNRYLFYPSTRPYPPKSSGGSDDVAIPGIRDLPEKDLKEMKDNDIAVREFCRTMKFPLRDRMTDDLNKLENEVKSIATQNITLSEDLSATKSTLQEMLKSVQDQKEECSSLVTDIQSTCSKLSPPSIVDRLKSSSADFEERSDEIAEKFLNGSMSTEDFLRNYMEARTSSHITKVKIAGIRSSSVRWGH